MANNEITKKKGGFGNYMKGVKTEMKKVIWPTKKDVISYTSVVIVTCVLFALIFFAVESGVRFGLAQVTNITLGQ